MHALKVLTYTFPLLSIPSPDATAYAASQTAPLTQTQVTNLNNHLQQVGLPPLRVIPNANANQNPNDPNNPLAAAEIRAIPLRALMVPLMMLTFRTLLLLYFFSPSKRPLFGIVLSAWILYEAWGAIRAVIGNNDQPQRGGNAADMIEVANGQTTIDEDGIRDAPVLQELWSRGIICLLYS